uniref:glucuronosyltransferase n=1 Tax=Malurus cyaneus samueli TaxID=2593467 RepID=A0A8C5U0Q4_9PASS
MWRHQVPAGLVLFLACWSLAEGGKLLVVPQDGSHWLSMRMVLEKLWEKGHEIVAVVPEAALFLKNSQSFTIKTYSVPYSQEFVDKSYQELGTKSFELTLSAVLSNISGMTNMFSSACRHLLYNEELIQYLQDSKFDAIMMDPVLPCGPILAEHLSLPSVYFMRGLPCTLDYKATQSPSPASYVPRGFSSSSDHMAFPERVKNFLISLSEPLFCHLFYSNYQSLASEFLQRDVTMQELFSQASVWLMRYDFIKPGTWAVPQSVKLGEAQDIGAGLGWRAGKGSYPRGSPGKGHSPRAPGAFGQCCQGCKGWDLLGCLGCLCMARSWTLWSMRVRIFQLRIFHDSVCTNIPKARVQRRQRELCCLWVCASSSSSKRMAGKGSLQPPSFESPSCCASSAGLLSFKTIGVLLAGVIAELTTCLLQPAQGFHFNNCSEHQIWR